MVVLFIFYGNKQINSTTVDSIYFYEKKDQQLVLLTFFYKIYRVKS